MIDIARELYEIYMKDCHDPQDPTAPHEGWDELTNSAQDHWRPVSCISRRVEELAQSLYTQWRVGEAACGIIYKPWDETTPHIRDVWLTLARRTVHHGV